MFRKIISTVVMFAFGLTSLNPAQAQMIVTPQIILPAVGAVVNVSKAFSPTLIKGLTVDQNDPFKFQFIMDTGDSGLEGEAFKNESYKMIKYFMASLATPENNMWVNLSPYEKDRIIPDVFGKTEMGRDLLAQDYILKQLTATLMSPENEEGKKFWEKIYTKIYESQSGKVSEFQNNKLSSMNSTHLSSSNVTHLSSSNVLVPSYRGLPKVVEDPASSVVKSKSNDSFDVMQQTINTFNKVWIVPQTGYFYEHNNSVFITDAKLKVMLEEDYVAAQKSSGAEGFGLDSRPDNTMTPETKQLIREVIIPIIEDEVNNGENFANLRQIYNAMLLSVWFKKRLKDHVLGQVYADKEEISGIRLQPSADGKYEVEKIWEQYVDAFKTGVSNVIKDEYDPATQSIVPKKYFSGGAVALDKAELVSQKQAEHAATFKGKGNTILFQMTSDNAQLFTLRLKAFMLFLFMSLTSLVSLKGQVNGYRGSANDKIEAAKEAFLKSFEETWKDAKGKEKKLDNDIIQRQHEKFYLLVNHFMPKIQELANKYPRMRGVSIRAIWAMVYQGESYGRSVTKEDLEKVNIKDPAGIISGLLEHGYLDENGKLRSYFINLNNGFRKKFPSYSSEDFEKIEGVLRSSAQVVLNGIKVDGNSLENIIRIEQSGGLVFVISFSPSTFYSDNPILWAYNSVDRKTPGFVLESFLRNNFPNLFEKDKAQLSMKQDLLVLAFLVLMAGSLRGQAGFEGAVDQQQLMQEQLMRMVPMPNGDTSYFGLAMEVKRMMEGSWDKLKGEDRYYGALFAGQNYTLVEVKDSSGNISYLGVRKGKELIRSKKVNGEITLEVQDSNGTIEALKFELVDGQYFIKARNGNVQESLKKIIDGDNAQLGTFLYKVLMALFFSALMSMGNVKGQNAPQNYKYDPFGFFYKKTLRDIERQMRYPTNDDLIRFNKDPELRKYHSEEEIDVMRKFIFTIRPEFYRRWEELRKHYPNLPEITINQRVETRQEIGISVTLEIMGLEGLYVPWWENKTPQEWGDWFQEILENVKDFKGRGIFNDNAQLNPRQVLATVVFMFFLRLSAVFSQELPIMMDPLLDMMIQEEMLKDAFRLQGIEKPLNRQELQEKIKILEDQGYEVIDFWEENNGLGYVIKYFKNGKIHYVVIDRLHGLGHDFPDGKQNGGEFQDENGIIYRLKENEDGSIDYNIYDSGGYQRILPVKYSPFPDGKKFLKEIRKKINKDDTISSLNSEKNANEEVGGVNLNSDQADIQIHQSENGFKFPKMDPAILNRDLKMIPVILNISPITTGEVRLLLGLNDASTDSAEDGAPKDSTDMSQPRDKMRELETTT